MSEARPHGSVRETLAPQRGCISLTTVQQEDFEEGEGEERSRATNDKLQ